MPRVNTYLLSTERELLMSFFCYSLSASETKEQIIAEPDVVHLHAKKSIKQRGAWQESTRRASKEVARNHTKSKQRGKKPHKEQAKRWQEITVDEANVAKTNQETYSHFFASIFNLAYLFSY
jgi:hypothetical protein